MQPDLEQKARREVERVDRIMSGLRVLDDRSGSLVEVLNSYHMDCRSFLEKGKFLEALEAAFICWAYVDAGLHLGVFEVSKDVADVFTVG